MTNEMTNKEIHDFVNNAWTPTKIVLAELKGTTKHSDRDLALVVFAPQTLKGYTVIERVPRVTGKSIPSLRKHATEYAARWSIPFIDQTLRR